MDGTIITKTTKVDNVTLITILEIPNEIKNIASIFGAIAQAGINIDMLGQTTVYGGKMSLSFTIDSGDLQKALSVIASVKKAIPSVKTDVSSGNSKLIFYGDAMRDHPGVAASVFAEMEKLGIESKLITSSEVDISVLVDESDLNLMKLELSEV